MLRQATLMVWANPYHALDHLGRPAGHCPKERTGSSVGPLGYVGCECVASAPIEVEKGSAASPDQDTCWHFSKESVKVLDTPYYRNAVRSGELFAADDVTAIKCTNGDVVVPFRPLEMCVAVSKDEAFAKWERAGLGKPEEVDPYKRPLPNGSESPMDVAAASGAKRAPEAHKAAQKLAEKNASQEAKSASASPSDPTPNRKTAGVGSKESA